MNTFTENDYFELRSKKAQGKLNDFERSVIEVAESWCNKPYDSFMNPEYISVGSIFDWWSKLEPDYGSKINSLTDRVNELENKLHESEIKYETAMNIIKDLTNKDK